MLGEGNIGFQVLNTAIGIVKNLAPLSLANEMQLSSTGVEGLVEMSEYLKEISLSANGACTESKREVFSVRANQRAHFVRIFINSG